MISLADVNYAFLLAYLHAKDLRRKSAVGISPKAGPYFCRGLAPRWIVCDLMHELGGLIMEEAVTA